MAKAVTKRDRKTRTQPKQPRKKKVTADWRPAFLASLSIWANITEACKAANVSRTEVYRTRDEDPAFAKLWETALEAATDRLEKEAVRRAVEGVEDYVVHKGDLVWVWIKDGQVVEGPTEGATRQPLKKRLYSDQLMTLLLRGWLPKKYRDRTELTGADGAPLGISFDDIVAALSRMDDPGTAPTDTGDRTVS